ncbi:YesL family protein [Salipaludibacillus sp. HK11]|uniref:YesL family protein n=1 Tax=Salipaludibacillus sp. HK11 TaxID=3394320 RepID=UPI0039FC3E40
MEIGGFAGIAYSFCRWFVRLAYLNLLWVIFSLVGLIVFGFFPSTVALFTVTRKWIMGDTDFPTGKVYWKTYKSEFIKSNVLGLILTFIGWIIYYNLMFLSGMEGVVSQILFLGMISMLIVYILILMYIFPVFVHYDTSLFQTIKNAFLIGVTSPMYTIIAVLSALLTYLLLILLDLFIFFNISTIGLLVMWCAYQSFEKIDRDKVEQETVSTH